MRFTNSPVGLISIFGTAKVTEDKLLDIIHQAYNFEPKLITKEIGTNDFYELSSYGHVGVLTDKLPWERLDKVEILKQFTNDN